MPTTIINHVPLEGCHVPPCKPLIIKTDMILWIFLFESEREAMNYPCPSRWGVWTSEKHVVHFLEIFFWRRVPAGVPKKCAKHIRDLTDFIVRTQYPVAYGGFSDVWKCQLQYKQSPPEKVAVKAIRSVRVNEGEYEVKKKDVKREFNIWAKLRHRNIVPLYGTARGFGQFPAFVCPWADNGTLSEYLEKFETELDMKKRLILLANIATGLRYLHSRKIVHGDLSSANILITKDGRACLADFGLSTLVEHVSDRKVSGILLPGNIRWAAPELFEEPAEGGSVAQLSSRQADIYSFGSIMLQTLSGKLPFHGIYRDAQIVVMISRGEKPPRELRWDGEDIPDALWGFIQTCWEAEPLKRPSSEEIVTFIMDQISRF